MVQWISVRRFVLAVGWLAAVAAMAGCRGLQERPFPPPGAPGGDPFHFAGAERGAVATTVSRRWVNGQHWTDITVDARTGDIFGLRDIAWRHQDRTWTAKICLISREGVIEQIIDVAGHESTPKKLRVWSDGPNERPGFVGFARPGNWVHVFDGTGAPRWSGPMPGYVIRVDVADLDADGTDELLVATSKGLLAIDRVGRELWRRDGSFFFTITMSGQNGERPLLFVARGTRILDATGAEVRQLRHRGGVGVGLWATVRRAGPEAHEVVAAGRPRRALTVQALSADGSIAWTWKDQEQLMDRERMSAVVASRDGRWVAVAFKSGRILLFDAAKRARAALFQANMSYYPSIAWSVTAEGAPLLLVCSARGIEAFTVEAPEG